MNRIIFFSFFSLLWLLSSCGSKLEKTHPLLENISESVYASGIIKSRDQYQVFSTVNGVVSELRVSEGDLVKKGDVLMSIRNETSRLNVESAKQTAAHANVQANTNKLKEARVSMELAHRKVEDDSLLWVRQRNLRAQQVGTQVELEQRELAYQNAITNYEVARLNYAELARDLAFSAEQSNINLKISQSLVNDYLIRAEADGKVYKVLKERGELATIGSTLFVMGAADDFLIELNVDEYDIARIRVEQQVIVTMDSYKGQTFEARVEKVEPLMIKESRSFIVNASFSNRPETLYPNLSAEANIVIRTRKNALTIPRSYLIDDSLVMVGKDKTRKVVIGIKDYRKAEVLRGLSESDMIYKPNP